ncbi:MAG: EAL domain-containing protein [Pseudomonadota bacterium]
MADALCLIATLEMHAGDDFDVDWERSLGAGLAWLHTGEADVILADLALPDSGGMDTFEALSQAGAPAPILILTENDSDAQAALAIQRGAEGNFSKAQFANSLLPHMLRNILQRRAAEQSLFIHNERAELTLNAISDAVIATDLAGRIDYMNAAAEVMTLYPREQALGQPIGKVLFLINGSTRMPERNPIDLVLLHDQAMHLTTGTVMLRRDGSELAIEDSAAPIHDQHGHIAGAVMVFHDITATLAMAVNMLHQAQHDYLTNLPNRLLLNDRIAQAIVVARRHATPLTLMFLDLDNFKHINDSLGHPVGDALLQSVARCLLGCVRSSDTVSRHGGDEFLILLPEQRDEASATLLAAKILRAIALPHQVAKHEIHVTASIGISTFPSDGDDAETLIKNADSAMYLAKEKGRNGYQFFKRAMNERAIERRAVETGLRQALEHQQFHLNYQPKVNLASGKISGSEALLRWNHPHWGMVMPDRFIPVAESAGLIVPIGRWVLHEACRQAVRWKQAGLDCGTIAVNISTLEFRHKDFVAGVRAVLAETGLAPACLELEITESVLMRDIDSSIATLLELKAMGVMLAIDDFGTGYSSLSYLKLFPIDILKIDRSFVRDIDARRDDGVIVSAVIAMGTSLHQRVVAEGVEEAAQLAFLKQRNCDEGQGYLFSRPVAPAHFATLLKTGINTPPVA